MALGLDARVLLLDEPMAGMGGEESRRMTELLQSLKGQFSILLVEHDMDAVFALADKVTVLVYGSPIFTGTPAEAREHAEVRAAYLGQEQAC
jgi:branched-chain amino acid transport system ATP-binding protein